MIVVDTSIWVEAFSNQATPHVEVLSEMILNRREIFLTPTILQETLQGIRNDDDFERLKYRFGGFPLLLPDAEEMAIQSATLYRQLRKKGVTIRKSNDCLIAAYAIHHGAEVFHNDRDFDLISQHSSLKIFKA